ncbi:MAG TPA: class I SAM-dependent methyltransferase [Thermoleophilia bacterium]|nr:class I SAM-dependent methyltransferase [Thermoleophilia bacterium]
MRGAMQDYRAYHTAELAELYDVVYADRDDLGFWQALAAGAGEGQLLELACGTGRILVPLARAGHEITGLDLSAHMLDRCRVKLAAEADEVRERVRLVQADLTSFDLGRRFALVTSPFRGFQHLRTVEQQLACLGRCHAHLRPGGKLVLDLFNPDPALLYAHDDGEPRDGEDTAETVAWTEGRSVRWWGTVVDYRRSLQTNECEMTYEIGAPGAAAYRLTEQFPMRYLFRYELEHLLSRAGFRVVALYGDYDRSPFADDSPELIAVAEAVD